MIVYLALIAALMTADSWFSLFGLHRGDGQFFMGLFLVAVGLATVVAVALIAAPLVALAPRARARHLQKD